MGTIFEQIKNLLYILLKEENKQIIDTLKWPCGIQSMEHVLLPYTPPSCLYLYFNLDGGRVNLNLIGFAKIGYHRYYQLKNDQRVKRSTHYAYALISNDQLHYLKKEVKNHDVYQIFQRDGTLPH